MTKPTETDHAAGPSPAARGPAAIKSFLRRVRRRLVADRFLDFLCTDVLVGLSLIALAVLLDRLLVPGLFRWETVAAVLGLTLVVTIWRTFARGGLSLFRTAVEADSRLALKERVATACYASAGVTAGRAVAPGALAQPPGTGAGAGALSEEWRALVLEDAERSVAAVSVSESFPVRLRRRAVWLVLPLFVSAALVLWLPRFDPLGLIAGDAAEDVLIKEAMAAEKKQLDEDLEKLLERAEKEESEEAKKLLSLLAEEIAKKEASDSPPSETEKTDGRAGEKHEPQKSALLELARREDVLKRGLENEKFRALKKALKELRGLQVKSRTQTRALEAALKDGDFQRAKRELDALKRRAAELSGKKPSELTREEKELLKKLEEELSQLASSAGALAQLAPNLGSLAGGVSAGDLQQMLENMDQFGMDLDSLAKMSNDLDFLNQALQMIQLSKQDLAALAQHKCPNCGKKLGKSNQPGGT